MRMIIGLFTRSLMLITLFSIYCRTRMEQAAPALDLLDPQVAMEAKTLSGWKGESHVLTLPLLLLTKHPSKKVKLCQVMTQILYFVYHSPDYYIFLHYTTLHLLHVFDLTRFCSCRLLTRTTKKFTLPTNQVDPEHTTLAAV